MRSLIGVSSALLRSGLGLSAKGTFISWSKPRDLASFLAIAVGSVSGMKSIKAANSPPQIVRRPINHLQCKNDAKKEDGTGPIVGAPCSTSVNRATIGPRSYGGKRSANEPLYIANTGHPVRPARPRQINILVIFWETTAPKLKTGMFIV